MSFNKIANAVVQEPALCYVDWQKMQTRPGRKVASAPVKTAELTRYLLTHCTIMASVMTEPEPEDWLIKPETAIFVNNNDDCWENTVLKMSYRTFVGAFNFLEHYQNSKQAKGHIVDAILRKVLVAPPDIWVYFCDILVATDLTQEKLITDIRSERIKYLSMGCTTALVVCSYCGLKVSDQDNFCQHLRFQKGTFVPDQDGVPRRVAELCGYKTLLNGGVTFIEASWVGTPAFPGAAKRSVVADNWLGPKTPYTHKNSSGTLKAASYDTAALRRNLR